MRPKFSLKRSFPRWIKEIDVTERKYFQLDGNRIFCNACSKPFDCYKKSQLTQHINTNVHKTSVASKNNAVQQLPVSETSLEKWIKEIDVTERKHFQLDGDGIFCNACSKRFEWDRKFLITQHCKTNRHKKSVASKNYAGGEGPIMSAKTQHSTLSPFPSTIVEMTDNACWKEQGQSSSSAPNVDETEGEMQSDDGPQFTCKTKLCVFCIGFITENDDDNGDLHGGPSGGINAPVVDTFLQGISVVCEILNAANAGKFSNRELWSLSGVRENFVRLVCCQKCYRLLANLVSLQERILATQATLNEGVRKIENFLVKSQRKAVTGDREYSINACVLFRDEILKDISQRDHNNHGQKKNQKLLHKSKKSPITSPDRSGVTLPTETLELSIPFVKLERLELPPNVTPHSKTLLDNDASNDDVFLNVPSPPGSDHNNSDLDFHPTKDNDEFLPTYSRNRNTAKKRGLPRARIDTSGNSKQRRTEEDDDYQPDEEPASDNSEQEDEYKPPSKKTFLSRKRGPLSAYQLAKKRYQVSAKKTKTYTELRDSKNNPATGRPAQVGSRRYRDIYEGRPKHRPIYHLESSQDQVHFMFYNVKFVKTLDFLQCLHPNCSHMQHLTGYFADQVAFRNFQLHVRRCHRIQYHSDEDMPKKYYYCHNCEAQVENIDDLLEHRRTLHPDASMPPVLCEVCGDIMPQAEIVEHIISHKSDEEKQSALNQKPGYRGKQKDITLPSCFPCDECDRVYKCTTGLRLHKESHIPLHMRKRLICEFCGAKFSTANILNVHRRRVHLKNSSRPFVCHICSHSFLSCERRQYNEHLRTHTGEKPYVCAQCGRAFNTKWAMGVHEKRHHNPNPITIPCEFCSNVYKELKYLRNHQLKHHPDKVERLNSAEATKPRKEFYGPKLMYPCEPCNHVFMFKSVLITHLKGKHNMQLANKEDYPAMWTYEHHYALDWKTI